jgi:diguanylate cyclase (GGDEF)-like protein/putative nucleotidyltransferase with HDIG domain
MKGLSRIAKLYIGVALAAAVIVAAWNLPRLRPQDVWLLLPVAALAAAAQVLKVEGATDRSSYNISWMAYGFALVRLGAPAAMFVILVAHVVEWMFHKYPWYIQTFNIATYFMAAQAAEICMGPAISSAGRMLPPEAIAILVAMAVFTGVNHLLVGLVIWLARGENLIKSGIFGTLTLMIDFSLLCLGTAAALVWTINPFVVVTVVVPLYLIYSTLRVPALERQTDTDPKTGLYNARYLKDALEKELAKAKRFARPLTVVMADLDYMRTINNTYGHLAGDTVLNGIAAVLQQSVRTYDVVARFGGEEFVILMPEVAPEEAVSRVDVMRRAIEAFAFRVATDIQPIHATISFGVAGYEHPDQTSDQIMHNADLAVYFSKLNGRNRVSLTQNGRWRPVPGAGWPEGDVPAVAAPSETKSRVPGQSQALPPVARREAATPIPETPESQGGEFQASPAPHASVGVPPMPRLATLKPAPPWLVKVCIAGLALVSLALVALMLQPAPGLDWVSLSVLALLVCLSEGLSIDIYVKDTSVSLATVPLVAGTLLFGPTGAVVLSLALAFTAKAKHHNPLRNFFFNLSNHLIGSLGCLALFKLAGVVLPVYPVAVQLILVLVSAEVLFLSTTALVAFVIRLDAGQPFQQTWLERFSWLWPYYLGMGAIAYTLMYSYVAVGLFGVIAVILPLAVLRYSQQLTLDRTAAMVKQLGAANDTLLKQSREVATLNDELLLALAHVVDLRDPDVLEHSQNVARYAVLIARELGLPPDNVELVRQAGLLHDIGKFGIPETILFKPGALSSEEYTRVKQHAALGAEIIADCHSLYDLVTIVRHHHERYDGQGYPDRLCAQDIPLEARIVALADAVEAMASDRPYRLAMTAPAILEEIRSQSGAQFDPSVATAFWNVVRKSSTLVVVNSARKSAGAPGAREAASVIPAAHLVYAGPFRARTTPV